MAIHAISGKPGGGKTLYAVKLVLDELIYGSRVVITNVAFRLPELNVYLQRMHPNRSVDLFGRLRILSDEDTSGFWTFRPAVDEVGKLLAGFHRIPLLDKSQWEAGDLPCYAGVRDHGVMYVIDECHNFFNARAWMKTGRDVLFYLSQHRKLGDTVVWITQAVSNVDKQFRSVTQDYTYVRNLSKEKMGMFRLPSRFLRRSYGEPATATSQCMESGTFTVDVSGVASCYDTAQGVGIHTRSAADKSEKKKAELKVTSSLLYHEEKKLLSQRKSSQPAKPESFFSRHGGKFALAGAFLLVVGFVVASVLSAGVVSAVAGGLAAIGIAVAPAFVTPVAMAVGAGIAAVTGAIAGTVIGAIAGKGSDTRD